MVRRQLNPKARCVKKIHNFQIGNEKMLYAIGPSWCPIYRASGIFAINNISTKRHHVTN